MKLQFFFAYLSTMIDARFELERAENCSAKIYAFEDALNLKSENGRHYNQNSLYIKITILYFNLLCILYYNLSKFDF